ncbi:hypothetical protein EX30DRAFT_395756 [Ascodesmis nigricans]|uniref:BTB domain-containing protein n=1 Tax=Ascodesmis nigricans TaxID=341454 RepID=A0A4S2MX91_9PEZI|nr:hypothetical protein EX30DRAFT_395756 [Ascodesmis nigricans]
MSEPTTKRQRTHPTTPAIPYETLHDHGDINLRVDASDGPHIYRVLSTRLTTCSPFFAAILKTAFHSSESVRYQAHLLDPLTQNTPFPLTIAIEDSTQPSIRVILKLMHSLYQCPRGGGGVQWNFDKCFDIVLLADYFGCEKIVREWGCFWDWPGSGALEVEKGPRAGVRERRWKLEFMSRVLGGTKSF